MAAPYDPSPDIVGFLQAVAWVLHRAPPIAEEVFDAAPAIPTESERQSADIRSLVRALRSGEVVAVSDIGVHRNRRVDRAYGKLRSFPIPPRYWDIEQILWAHGALFLSRHWEGVSKVVASQEVGLPRRFHELEGPAVWTHIRLPIAKLKELFPEPSPSSAPAEKLKQGGRPPKYKWPEFTAQLILLAEHDQLPERQAECERKMQAWCLEAWGEPTPSESQIREQVGAVYKALRDRGERGE